MSEQTIATVIASTDPEGSDVTWQEVGQTPSRFLAWLIRRIAVDFSKVKGIIPISITREKVSPADQGKIHIMNTKNPRIGVPTEEGYKYFDRYPRNVMMIWRGNKDVPSFFTVVPDVELEQLGLPKNVPNSAVWVVYPE